MNTELRCLVEIRDDDERRGPGILSGILMKYGASGERGRERFAPGALHWPENGVVLREQHNRAAPITRFDPVVDGDTVRVEAVLPDTMRARDAAELVRNGTFRGLSVEFVAERESRQGGVRVVERALLRGAGLVDDASYPAAAVSMRSKTSGHLEVPWWL